MFLTLIAFSRELEDLARVLPLRPNRCNGDRTLKSFPNCLHGEALILKRTPSSTTGLGLLMIPSSYDFRLSRLVFLQIY